MLLWYFVFVILYCKYIYKEGSEIDVKDLPFLVCKQDIFFTLFYLQLLLWVHNLLLLNWVYNPNLLRNQVEIEY